jgi:hypothetical protein
LSFLWLVDARHEDWRRHVADLQTRTYEGASERADREELFRRGFELATPVAVRVLEKVDGVYLSGTGEISVTPPAPDGARGLRGSWNLTWPLLEQAVDRFTNEPMPPVRISTMFPRDFTHPHVSLYAIRPPYEWVACWPFQVMTTEDAERQEAIFFAVAEAEVHERTFAGDLNWRLLPSATAPAR